MQTMTSGQAACLAGSSRVVRRASVTARPQGGRPALVVVAGNDYETGVFSPLVVVVRNAMGVKEFNQFRGKAISLHSQVSAKKNAPHTPSPARQARRSHTQAASRTESMSLDAGDRPRALDAGPAPPAGGRSR
jgi:hypothetical protein